MRPTQPRQQSARRHLIVSSNSATPHSVCSVPGTKLEQSLPCSTRKQHRELTQTSKVKPQSRNPLQSQWPRCSARRSPSPGGEAGLDDLDAELVVEVAEAQQLRPPALVADQRVDADVGAHRVEGRPERRALPDLLPAQLDLASRHYTVPSRPSNAFLPSQPLRDALLHRRTQGFNIPNAAWWTQRQAWKATSGRSDCAGTLHGALKEEK